MSPAGRIADRAADNLDVMVNRAATGSSNILINMRHALRIGDVGVDKDGRINWEAADGAPSVLLNGRKVHRAGDTTQHGGASGRLFDGSPNVMIGNYIRQQNPRTPGIKIRMFWSDGTPIDKVTYRLSGPEERRGTINNGWIDERNITEGVYKLEIDGHVCALSSLRK